jgi:hypothetical protein
LNAQDISQILMRYASNQELVDFLMPSARRNNRYCLPVLAAINDFNSWVRQLWSEQTPILEVARRWNRYSSVNLASYTRHGTVEFRQHNGSIDPEVVANWIQFCVYFVETSRYSPTANMILNAVPATPVPVVVPRSNPVVMLNGVRLNRRVRYDRRRGLFAMLVVRSAANATVDEHDLTSLLRASNLQVRTMIRDLNNIAMQDETAVVRDGIQYFTTPARGFYISNVGSSRAPRYKMAAMADILRGSYHSDAWVNNTTRNPAWLDHSQPQYFYAAGTVAPPVESVVNDLLTWLGGMMPDLNNWTFSINASSGSVGERWNRAGSSFYDDWTWRYAQEWRRHPRITPVDTNTPPPAIPRNRRTVFAGHPIPRLESFAGLDSLFAKFPTEVRAYYMTRAVRYRAPWLPSRNASRSEPDGINHGPGVFAAIEESVTIPIPE